MNNEFNINICNCLDYKNMAIFRIFHLIIPTVAGNL